MRHPVLRRSLPATHIAWLLRHGSLPDGDMLHHCDNTRCVNPDHLYVGDDRTNIRDAVNRLRHARRICAVRTPDGWHWEVPLRAIEAHRDASSIILLIE
jgi:hypothetical protein